MDIRTPLEDLPLAVYESHGAIHPICRLQDGRRGDMFMSMLGANGKTPERVCLSLVPGGQLVTARLVETFQA